MIPNATKINNIAKILNQTNKAATHLIRNIKINEIPIAKASPTNIQYQFYVKKIKIHFICHL